MVFQAPLFFSILFSISRGISVSQFVRDAHNGYSAENAQVKLVRHPTGGTIDTVSTTVWFGMWATDGANFEPDLKPGDKLEVIINKDGYTAHVIDSIKNTYSDLLPDVHIDDPNKPPRSRTPIIYVVKDTSEVNAPLYGIFTLKKNLAQPCTALVDTSSGPDRVFDWFVNTEFQDSTVNHGDSAYITLQKTLGETTYVKTIEFMIDTTEHYDVIHIKSNGNSGNDTIIFPYTFIVNVEEKTIENKVKKDFQVVPSHGKIFSVIGYTGKISIYDETGRKIGVSMVQDYNSKLNLGWLPAGRYFIKVENKKDNGLEQIIKIE
ncbi:MAG: T9SS type A sorting domain-containing protein [Candidatus Pacearchaeota archaeon]